MPINASRSFRLSVVTSSQLDDLAAFWGESITAALGRAIDREWNRTIYAGPIMPPTQAPDDNRIMRGRPPVMAAGGFCLHEFCKLVELCKQSYLTCIAIRYTI